MCLINYVQLQFEVSRKLNSAFFVIIADLDYFKRINDTFGHDYGNDVLTTFARTCETVLRKGDCVVRFGAESGGIGDA
ncbi:MAG: diguanylate cyclase (GGDEF)-like protein [Paraglaciecola sp.]|jgi:diguanylate cyclase (GGDEF)-like protein